MSLHNGSASSTQRVLLQPAFLLHHRPYRDTSRILELFTRDYGRITLFARGARRAGSALVPVLQPFNRLLVSWSGRGEAGRLIGAELDGPPQAMWPQRLMSGFYLNELMLKLFERHDAHADVFDLYAGTLEALKSHEDESRALRVFEKRLLQALGYGLALRHEALSGASVVRERTYRYELERGLLPCEPSAGSASGLTISGRSLLSLDDEVLDDAVARTDARRLLRAVLDRLLEGRGLNSREISTAIRRMKQ